MLLPEWRAGVPALEPDETEALMSKTSKRPPIAMPTSQEDKAITAAAKSDPDAQPFTPRQLKSMDFDASAARPSKVRKPR